MSHLLVGSTRRHLAAVAIVAAAGLLACVGACSQGTAKPPAAAGGPQVGGAGRPIAAAVFPAEGAASSQPWSFAGAAGQVLTTNNFTIYTTETNAALIDRVPKFMERALQHYLTAITEDRPLPPPSGKMESFVMGSRQQWKELVLSMLGKQAQPMLQIPAGGFATGGRAFLFDIGLGSTFFVASHEGWHQYSQRTFAEPMPIFLEEGVATYMEGHRWEGLEVQFLPWSNIDRFEQLRTAAQSGRLLPLRDLIETAPQRLIGQPGDGALTYYAQLWALVHFLNEGDGGIYRPMLRRIIADAQAGKLSQSVAAQLAMSDRGGMLAKRQGIAVFRAYFDRDIDAFNARYVAFVAQITRPGARDLITLGRSPVLRAASAEVMVNSILGSKPTIPQRGIRRANVSQPGAPANVN